MDIYLLHYNNYYNRILKRLETTQEYLDADAGYQKQALVSFNLNDGIMTSQVVNFDSEHFDYAIVTENSTEDPETHVITPGVLISRWFIMQANRNRTGQWTLQLQRDLVADHYNELKEAPVFVEKATIQSDTDVAIYNKEANKYNEVKQEETLLKDLSNTPWIVGYFASNNTAKTATYNPVDKKVEIYDTQSAWPLNKYLTNGFHHVRSSNFTVVVSEGTGGTLLEHAYIYHSDKRDTWYDYKSTGHKRYKGLFYQPSQSAAKQFAQVVANRKSELQSTYLQYLDIYDTENKVASYIGEESKIIKFADTGRYYIVSVTKTTSKTETLTPGKKSAAASALAHLFEDFRSGSTYYQFDNNANTNVTAYFNTDIYTVTLSEIVDSMDQYKFILAAGAGKLKDNPYSMFAIPYKSINVRYKDTEEHGGEIKNITSVNKDISLGIAIEMAKELDATLYDVQLLPYCPRQDWLERDYGLDLVDRNADFVFITKEVGQQSTNVGVVIFPQYSKFDVNINTSLNIDRQQGEIKTYTDLWTVTKNIHWLCDTQEETAFGVVEIDDNIEIIDIASVISRESELEYSGEWKQEGNKLTLYATYTGSRSEIIEDVVIMGSIYTITTENINSLIVDKKIDNNCTKYRLNSPNNAGSFDFNLNRNGGSVNKFNVDCYYKPYNPYIHVNPEFAGLYGNNYRDYRGLICQGDFSVPVVNSEWKNYELNNKNYQNTFNREITQIEKENAVAKITDVAQAVGGTIQGGVSGAQAGSKAGPVGAIAGAALGATAGAMGGTYDVLMNDWARGQQVNLTIDKFNYNLQNIQARPYTLTKSTALDANNRLWPYLEKYKCTEQEINMFKDNMKYEGMTIDRIDTISSFLSDDYTYIRCQLIRSTAINCDDAQLKHIGRELNLGLYMKG